MRSYFQRFCLPASISAVAIFFLLLLFSQILCAQNIITISGTGIPGFSGNGGPAASAQMNAPAGLAIDQQGNLYVAEFNNHRVRKIDAATGNISTIAGNGTAGLTGDGSLATNARLNNPSALCMDQQGNLYILDSGNLRIRKVNTSTGIISSVAGNGTTNYASGAAATATGLNQPSGLAIDAGGNLYISQAASHIISKLNAANGTLSTFAGTGIAGYAGDDGQASLAQLSSPAGLSMDASGNLYIADLNNHLVRKVNTATGTITSVAGSSRAGYSGDGKGALAAQLKAPNAVWADASGNLYIAERGNNRIRRVSQINNLIFPLAGNGTSGFAGDGGQAICARLNGSYQVVTGRDGSLYISDRGNNRIRKVEVTANPIFPQITITPLSTTLCTTNPISYTAVATNAGANPVYQWKVNGINAGTNSPSFTLPNTGNAMNVVVCELTSNDGCTTTVASNAVVTGGNGGVQEVEPEVTITASSENICAGTNVTFTARNTSGSLTPSYSWMVNGNGVGTNSPTFTTSTLTDGAVVTCVMRTPHCTTGSTKKTSNAITISVDAVANSGVSISASTTSACKGSPVTFTAVPTGTQLPSFTFQWKVNGNPIGENRVLYTSNSLSDGDKVQCVMSTGPGTTCSLTEPVSSNTITIRITEATPPAIAITASASDICAGQQVSFSATATNQGTSPVYQWYVNGTKAGTNSPELLGTQLADGDKVHCTVTGGNGGCIAIVSSDTIIMTVKPAPEISFPAPVITINAGTQTELNATVKGRIASFLWTPENKLTNAATLTPLTLPLEQDTRFGLKVVTQEGCEATKEVQVVVVRKLHMPTAFTPNGDGINDVFRIPTGTTLELKNFSVFDRWGNRIFHTRNIQSGWNGTYKGMLLPTGVYIYYIGGHDEKGTVQHKGTVMLVR